MKIGFDAKRAFHNHSGLGNYSRFVIESLSKYYPYHHYFLYTTPYQKTAMHKFARRENIIVRCPRGLLYLLPSLWRTYGIAKAAEHDGIKIFHGLSHELPVGIEKTGIKTLVTVHDLIFMRYPEYYSRADVAIYKRKVVSACHRADMIIAVSKQTKRDIIDFLGIDESKIKVVYQGCDPQFYDAVSSAEKAEIKAKYSLPDNYILSVGTVETRKNLLSIVRATPFLPAEFSLVAVGKHSDYANEVMKEVAKLGLSERVSFINKADFKDFPGIYQQASAFVYPSEFEGFGIPILEALNSGVPVIAARTSSLPEVGGEAALYIEPHDYQILASHLNNILNDADLRKRMTTEGVIQAKKFREKHTVPALWQAYLEVQS
ncbi:MAG: glycosyltransferase family 4 protein [Prevotellaceae bacterium]|jgi:glycosyltransferase involved in cell wall biosynthesis|nr:glycosyltransferase family 4 protein [Prevotellaceae bacterium]